MFSGVAVAATGVAVSSGIALKNGAPADAAGAALASAEANHQDQPVALTSLSDRTNDVSRSAERPALGSDVDPSKLAALSQQSGGAVTRTEDMSNANPKDIAKAMMPQFGFSLSEFSCLDALWTGESNWNPHADNPTSTAYGIPQALVGTHALPSDYMTNPVSQIRWGLGYIRDAYGTPCAAEAFKLSHNWY
jgi:hypothetical protein